MGVSSLFFGLLNWAVFDSFTESLVARIGQRFTESQTLYSKAHTLQPLVSEIPLVRQTANDPLVEDWVANERDETRHKLAIAQMRRNFSGHDYFVALTDSNTFYYDNHIQQRRTPLTRRRRTTPGFSISSKATKTNMSASRRTVISASAESGSWCPFAPTTKVPAWWESALISTPLPRTPTRGSPASRA
jgi:hypothetical protein